MASRSSILAWSIPWTKEPGGLLSTGSQKVGHYWSNLAHMYPCPQLCAGACEDTVFPPASSFSPSPSSAPEPRVAPKLFWDAASPRHGESQCHLCPVPHEKWKCQSLSYVWLFATPWTVAHQAPLSTEFSRQECWSGEPFLSLRDPPNPGIELKSPALQAHSLLSEPPICYIKAYKT